MLLHHALFTEVTIQANEIERQEVETSDLVVKVDVPKKQKSKKRKQREDDEGNNITKVNFTIIIF